MARYFSLGPNKDQWLVEAKEIFSDRSFTQTKYIPSLNAAFRELTKLYKTHTSTWWEIQSLTTYIAENIVPRGLRITLTPANKHRSPEFMLKWEKEATAASIKLMQLLLEEEKSSFSLLESQLKEQIEICKKFEDESEFANKEKQLQNTLEKHQFHLKDRKHKQYVRDSTDFKEQRAYSFVNNQAQREPETEVSSTDDTEISDSDRDITNRGPKQHPRGRGGKGRSRPTKNKGQGRGVVFLDPKHPYQLRERTFPPIGHS